MYLTRKALEETLEAARSIAAPGSEIAMDFWFLPDAHDWQSTARRIVPNLLHLVGEPLVMSLHPDDCAGFLARVGFDSSTSPVIVNSKALAPGRRSYPACYVTLRA